MVNLRSTVIKKGIINHPIDVIIYTPKKLQTPSETVFGVLFLGLLTPSQRVIDWSTRDTIKILRFLRDFRLRSFISAESTMRSQKFLRTVPSMVPAWATFGLHGDVVEIE